GEEMSASTLEALAADVAEAEETLARMEALAELPEPPSPGLSGAALTAEEQAVYDELARDT
ncbi:MAG: hypothetical protein NZ561_08715, partial [Phycisphaerae bacterium]|nr:hypothetical protein [Phycisphaerae bacterium]MDW8261095.1 hypothetical protein [Phycisphaerales bacterium]